ncbi:hypothetical protein ACIBF5_22225 [Micromonospora sp. NPDC050417]|uniref:hypothetical protein n=1 Tax=Micromonospora sp. NPDC050417 TaxID=3364280 RepID=UPI00379E30A7
MRDENLVGLWDSSPYDYGSMESSWVCLRRDGTGWTAVANTGSAAVSQLTWDCSAEGEVELRYTWTASGSWAPGTPFILAEVDEEGPYDERVRTRYSVGTDMAPMADSPATALRLEESVEFTQRFALMTRDTDQWGAAPAPAVGDRPEPGA